MTIATLVPVEYSTQRVLTTEQLADAYECNADQIRRNYSNNKEHFEYGKHYFKLEGETLKMFADLYRKNLPTQISPMTRSLYLWTKRGALRHCKMLGTDKAWEMFDLLEENYFDGKKSAPAIQEVKPSQMVVEIGAMSTAIARRLRSKTGYRTCKSYGHNKRILQV